MIKKLLILLSIFLLSISSAIGADTYPNAGGEDHNWLLDGRGSFSGIGTDVNTFGKGLSNPIYMPIIDDFNADGVTEMFILNGDTGIIYQNKELDVLSSFDIGAVPTGVSNIISFDIDGDGDKEIIFAAASTDTIRILNYSTAAGLGVQKVISIVDDLIFPMIGCANVSSCIVVYPEGVFQTQGGAFDAYYNGMSFDHNKTTSAITRLFTQSRSAGQGMTFCPPRLRNIAINDFDNDDTDEYLFTFARLGEGTNSVQVVLTALDNLTQEFQTSESNAITVTEADCEAEDSISQMFTSPLTAEIYSSKNNKETFVGVMVTDTDFRIFAYAADGTKFKQFPDVFTADGIIISNPMLGNFFPSTGEEDICVLGYEELNDEIDLLCGTESRGFPFGDDGEFKYSADIPFNVSFDFDKMTHVAHAVQHSTGLTDLVDLNEIISPYGIFTLDYEFANELLRVWKNPVGESTALSIDFEQFGADDIILMTETNIFYIDDRLSNEGAAITQVGFNPCVKDSAIRVNTTLQITVDVQDQNNPALGFDDVNVNISIYEGSADERFQAFLNVTTSQVDGTTTVIASTTVNVTGNNKRILISAWDSENPTEIDTVEQVFTVNFVGAEFGDSTCTTDFVADEDEDEEILEGTLTEDADDNAIITGMQTFIDLSGLGGTSIWLLIMIIFSIGMWFEMAQRDLGGSATLGAIGIFNILMIVLGARMNIISTELIVILVVISGVILSIFIGKFITGLAKSEAP